MSVTLLPLKDVNPEWKFGRVSLVLIPKKVSRSCVSHFRRKVLNEIQ